MECKLSKALEQTVVTLKLIPGFGLDEVYQMTQRLNDMDPDDIDAEEADKCVSSLMYYHFILPRGFSSESNFLLWRARKNEVKDELFTKTSQLGCPPRGEGGQQRFNGPDSPLLYASLTPSTVFAESRLVPTDRFHLTSYKFRQGQTLLAASLGDIDNIRRTSKTLIENQSYVDAYKWVLDRLEHDVRWSVYLVDAFFADWMQRRGERHYTLTSAIAKEVLAHEQCQALVYPSVEHKGGVNFAVKDTAASLCLQALSVQQCMSGTHYGYELRNVIRSDPALVFGCDGTIHWPQMVKDNINRELDAAEQQIS